MRPILSDNRLPGWRNRFARARQAGKSLNFASPDSGKGREKENNRACDMPLQADSVFFVSSLFSPPPPLRVLFVLLLFFFFLPLLLFTVRFCATHFFRDTRVYGNEQNARFRKKSRAVCCSKTYNRQISASIFKLSWSRIISYSFFFISWIVEFLFPFDVFLFFNLESNNNCRVDDTISASDKLLFLVKATRFLNLLGIESNNVRVVGVRWCVAEETRRRQLQYFLRCERGWAWLTLWQPVVKCSTLPCVLSSTLPLYIFICLLS